MKTLINNLISIIQTAITGVTISAVSVQKGLSREPSEIPLTKYPYVAIDDGGERVEDIKPKSQNRIYSVIIELGVYTMNRETSIDAILDLTNEIKTLLETQTNRQKDGHIWGVNIQTWDWENDRKFFFRGRTITVDFIELEDKYLDY